MASIDRQPVDAARSQFSQARLARQRAQADLAAATATLAALQRTAPPDDAALQAAQAAVTGQQGAVADAWTAENTNRAALTTALGAWLPEDYAQDVARLEPGYPIALFPVRLETRFQANKPELLVRVYPDTICADAHEPELSTSELAAGQAYWSTVTSPQAPESLAAWQTLLATYPPPRAAWIVRVTDPYTQVEPPAFVKPSGWSRAVEARMMPDRFVVVATRGATVRRAVGSPVVDPLALSIGPDTLDSVQLGPDPQFLLDPAVKWTVEFDAAVAAGMAIRVPLDADDLRLGFDRLVVLGVRTATGPADTAADLATLFDAHHFSDGLAFLRQGTPTSNAIGTPAAYPPVPDNDEHSFAVERGPARDATPNSAGATLTQVLNLPRRVFQNVDGAELTESLPARSMNRVLYSATLGYFLDQLMYPLLTRDQVNEVGQYFSQWVLPRGLCSAFRVGRVPYGVLPATSLARWQDGGNDTPVQRRMAALLRQTQPIWAGLANAAPHVGRSADPDKDLLDILAMDASAREVRVRRVLGDGAWLNLARMFNWPVLGWENYHKAVGAAVLSAAGIAGPQPPRILAQNFAQQSFPYHGTLVDTVAVSETDPLGPRDYLSWARHATLDQLHLEQLPGDFPAGTKQVLLYRFVRHATLAEYHWWAGALLAVYAPAVPGAAAPSQVDADFREPELVGVVPGTESRQTPWQRFTNQVSLPTIGLIDLAALLDGDYETELRSLTGVGDFRDALAALAPLPTAELERLFTESLDASSHRIDAWITSLANRRLAGMVGRSKDFHGCFAGAYGWLENLRAEAATTVTLPDGRTLRTTPGGYVHAPSTAHATTAAVLRNAYLTHLTEQDSPYAIDLSSERVRMARFVLDSVRNGQPVGAVFGYLLERAFHERGAESLIDPVRQVAPLVANKVEDSGEQADTVAARNVVDGLVLRDKWKAGQLFGVPGGLSPDIAHRDVLEHELSALDNLVDAVADLLLAESVHQVVRGSTMASGAGLDALAQGTRPPDPAVAQGITGGTSVTYRLAVALDAAGAPPPGWPATPTPRAACEPRLDAWVATLLGDPRTARCQVSYQTAGGTPTTVMVTADQLGLRPLDVLALAGAVATEPAASELDRRVLHAAFGDTPPADTAPGTSFEIRYEPDPGWDRATTRSVPELLDVAAAIATCVGGMRALAPTDLVLPENASSAATAVANLDEARLRAQAAAAGLGQVHDDLDSAIAAVPADTEPTPAQAAALRDAMRAAAGYGVAAAYPAFVAGDQEGGLAALPLLDQARSVLADIASRLAAAAQVPDDPPAQASAVFGRDFRLLTGFSFGTGSAPAAELGQALDSGATELGEPTAVDRWLTSVVRIREPLGRWRLMRLLAEAAAPSGTASTAAWHLAQLPHRPGATWVALPPAPGQQHVSGTVSLLVYTPGGAPQPDGDWYGLFLDQWTEAIPNEREHTGISLRHEGASTEAAQTVLLAVPPASDLSWDFDSLLAVVTETLDLAKVRAVDLELLDPIAQLVPGIFLAANASDDTIATNLVVRFDPVIATSGGE